MTMPTVVVYGSSGAIESQSVLADDPSLAIDGSKLIWVDFDAPPAPDQQALLAKSFDLGPHAIAHLSEPHRGPRAVRFRTCGLIVAYDAELDVTSGAIQTNQIVMLIGNTFLVTAHSSTTHRVAEAAGQVAANFDDYGVSTTTIVYTIANAIVDGYFDVLDGVQARVDALRKRVLANDEQQGVEDVYQLTNELGVMQRVISPEQDLFGSAKNSDGAAPSGELEDAFLDLSHDLQSAGGEIGQYSNVLSNLLDTYESSKSDALNQLVKRLTVLSILVALVALIPAILGISLNHSPFDDAWKGYVISASLMGILSFIVWGVAKRIGWLK